MIHGVTRQRRRWRTVVPTALAVGIVYGAVHEGASAAAQRLPDDIDRGAWQRAMQDTAQQFEGELWGWLVNHLLASALIDDAVRRP